MTIGRSDLTGEYHKDCNFLLNRIEELERELDRVKKIMDGWHKASFSGYKWKVFTNELKRIIEERRGGSIKRANVFRYITDDDVIAACNVLDVD